jgi:hypothetical protein
LLRQTKISADNFHFIADQVDTLTETAKLNIRLFLASWGYPSKQQISQTEKSAISVITLTEFFQIFRH